MHTSRKLLPAVLAIVLIQGLVACTPPYTSGEPIDPNWPEKHMLVVLDVQNDFMDEDGAFPVDPDQAVQTLEQINGLLTSHRDSVDAGESGMRVVYAKNDFDPADPANPFRGNSAIEGSEGAELDERLIRVEAPLFSKKESDAFSSDAFESHLRAEKITHLYLTGVFSDGCVYATALAAAQRGFAITIVTDAVATADDDRLVSSMGTFEAEGFALVNANQAKAALINQGQ
jgi:nicotinamidase-related amidase